MLLTLHIPMCGSTSCESHMQRLRQICDYNDCFIEDDMKIIGRYSYHFKENLAKCSVTILHYCQQLWNKICDFEESLDHHQKRIVCVNFNKSTRTSHGHGATNEMDTFFNGFNMTVLRDEKDMTELVISTIKVLGLESGAFADSGNAEVLAPANPPIPHLRKNGRFTQNVRNINAVIDPQQIFERLGVVYKQMVNAAYTPDAAFVAYPDVQERMHMYVPCAYLRRQGLADTVTRLDFSKMKSITDLQELIQQLATDDTFNISFLLNKVIPEFYSSKFAIGLVTVAAGQNNVLAERSVFMLELLLFRGQLSDSFTTVDSLIWIADTVVLMRNNLIEDALIKRLAHMILLLHLETLLKISNEETRRKFENFKTHLSLTLEKYRKDESMKSVLKIVDMMLGKTAINVSSKLHDILRISSVDELVEFNRDFWGKDLSQTLAFVFVCLKKLFASMSLRVVNLLEECLVSKSRRLLGQPKINSVVAAILFSGLSHFVSYGLREAPHRNLFDVFSKSLQLIYTTSKKQCCIEVTSVHQALLFDPSADIRNLAIDYLVKKGSYNKCIGTFIQKDIQCVMYPYLQISSTVDKRNDVVKMLGTFGKYPVKIYALVPSEAQHRGGSVSSIDQVRLNRLKKQINIRKDLNHRHIIKLFVYRMASLPKFYVLEYYTSNLQDDLANRYKNSKFCEEISLLSIMVQASSAVEYLHNVAGVLHCSITAASLHFCGKDHIKLGAFQLAITDKNARENFLDDKSSIPTRWSAPETLRSGAVSKHSDVYMLGSLMYEILTHGVLPHCRRTLDDELYIKQIIHHPIQTFREECFKEEQYRVMTSCLQHYPNKRPCVTEVRSTLQKLLESFPTDEVKSPIFPNIKKEHLRLSTEFNKVLPTNKTYVHTMFAEPINIINSTVHVYSLGEFYLTREIVKQRFPKALVIKILRGDLESLAPRINIDNTERGVRREHIIDIIIPATCSGDVPTLIENRQICCSKENCILLLIAVVEMLKVIHSAGCTLYQLKPFYLYLDTTGSHIKVYPVSIAQLQFNDGNTMKTTTDVKYFGEFMRWLYRMVDCFYHEESVYDYIEDLQVPKSCPVNVFKLIQRCVSKKLQDRPTCEEIIRELSCELPSKLTPGPFLQSCSLLLNVINPSDSESDDSDDDEYETYDFKRSASQPDLTTVKEVVNSSGTTSVKSEKFKNSKRFKKLFSFAKRRHMHRSYTHSKSTSSIYLEINSVSYVSRQEAAAEIQSKHLSRPLPSPPLRRNDKLPPLSASREISGQAEIDCDENEIAATAYKLGLECRMFPSVQDPVCEHNEDYDLFPTNTSGVNTYA